MFGGGQGGPGGRGGEVLSPLDITVVKGSKLPPEAATGLLLRNLD